MTPPDFERYRTRVIARRDERMPEFVARATLDAAAIAELQRARLRELVAWAAEHSPFYARRLRGLDPTRMELADLPRVPAVTKAELMSDLDDVFTDRRLRRPLLEDALAATKDMPVPVCDEYLVQATGGSSGRRGIFVSDVDAGIEVSAAVTRAVLAYRLAGPGMPRDGLRIGLVAAASPVHSTGLVTVLNPPGAGPVSIHGVPATLPPAEMQARLEAIRPHQLAGYPGVLARLARERRAGRLRIEPEGITTTSEMLTPELRASIREGFGVPVVDVFGSTEGLMGATAPDDPVFVFNSDTCIVELVDEHERPVPPGTPSDHVLVTNLANRVQPLIRYRLDDRFTQQPPAVGHGHLRATVEGRADDVLRYDGVEIHPIVVRAVLLKHPAVHDYQVRQTAGGVHVSVVAEGPLDASGVAGELRAALAAAGLPSPRAVVEPVGALERHAETGKLRRFVPLPAGARA